MTTFMSMIPSNIDLGNRKIHIVSVQGNIGGGKTTHMREFRKAFLDERISEKYNLIFVDEPVNEWMRPYRISEDVIVAERDRQLHEDEELPEDVVIEIKDGQIYEDGELCNPFTDFNKDKSNMAFKFQIMAFTTRVRKQLEVLHEAFNEEDDRDIIMITERSMLSDRNVFVLANVESGNFPVKDTYIYDMFYDLIVTEFNQKEILMINIETDVDVCSERIKIRERVSEDLIPRDYLSLLEKYGSKMVENFDGEVISIDNNAEILSAESEKMEEIIVSMLRILECV